MTAVELQTDKIPGSSHTAPRARKVPKEEELLRPKAITAPVGSFAFVLEKSSKCRLIYRKSPMMAVVTVTVS